MEIKDTIKANEPKVVLIESRRYLWYKIAGVAAVLIMVFGLYLSWPLLEKRMLSQDLTSLSIPDHEKNRLPLLMVPRFG
ncbi:hypothetical protein [Pedobacter panaciterrae]